MQNVFLRRFDKEAVKGLPLSDYKPEQLVAHLIQHYPGDPIGALQNMMDNYEVGYLLYNTTLTLLEGFRSDKRDEML